MNEEKLFEAIGEIDDKYIEEARSEGKIKRKRLPMALVACFILLIVGATLCTYILINDNTESLNKAYAAEIGKETIHLGAAMPRIIYFDDEKVIMYDYIGIWVFNFKEEQLAGFCDFRPINMTQIQGYPCVFVETSLDGKYVRFYMSDDSRKYLYDVERDSYEKVDSYDNRFEWGMELNDVSAEHSISEHSSTYQVSENEFISYVLDTSANPDNILKYKDLVIIKEVNGQKVEFRPFTED